MATQALFFKGMDRIEIAHRLATWVHLAKDKVEDDAVFSFISAWIAFNYFYTTFSISLHRNGFEHRTNDEKLEPGDRSQWRFLIRHEQFEDFFKKFRQNKVLGEQIKLTIECMLTEREVPDARMRGSHRWNDLSTEQIFSV